MKLLKKNDDDIFMSVAKKPKGGKKGGAAAAAVEATPAPKAAEPAKKRLNHSVESLTTFMKFQIEVPQTTAELPDIIAKVSGVLMCDVSQHQSNLSFSAQTSHASTRCDVCTFHSMLMLKAEWLLPASELFGAFRR